MKDNSALPKNIGVWIRVSTEDQARGDSPAIHEARARAYATARGWTVREVYDLAGVSGKSVMAHNEARRMMADVKRGHVTGLIFSKLARLSRNLREVRISETFSGNRTPTSFRSMKPLIQAPPGAGCSSICSASLPNGNGRKRLSASMRHS
jgi:hypothetical protein